MGEEAQRIGKKLECFGWNLFDSFAWNEKFRDKQVDCSRSGHKNGEGNKKTTHGVDIYFEFNDPYINKTQGVFVECKNRQWASITKANIELWVEELVNTIECSSSYNELQQFYGDDNDRNCGLLLINASDNIFDKEIFYGYLKKISFKSKRTPYKIFIASNDMINKWWSINNINATDYKKELKYYYVSINNSRPLINSCLSINHLFSKYIFAEYEYDSYSNIGGNMCNYKAKKMVIFCFDIISKDCFNYLWSMCRFFQYETGYQEFDICFFPYSSKDVEYIKDYFIATLKQYEHGIDQCVFNTIKFKILQNRELSVVDND